MGYCLNIILDLRKDLKVALSPSLVIWKISLQITWEDLEEGKGRLNDVIIIPKNIF